MGESKTEIVELMLSDRVLSEILWSFESVKLRRGRFSIRRGLAAVY